MSWDYWGVGRGPWCEKRLVELSLCTFVPKCSILLRPKNSRNWSRNTTTCCQHQKVCLTQLEDGCSQTRGAKESTLRAEVALQIVNSLLYNKNDGWKFGRTFEAPLMKNSVSVTWSDLRRQLGKTPTNEEASRKVFNPEVTLLKSLVMPYSHKVFPFAACQVFPRYHHIYRPITLELYCFFKTMFHSISDTCHVRLDQYDFHHGHMFYNSRSQTIGILFHHSEYPSYCAQLFPYDLGYCQKGSDVSWEYHRRFERNALWVYGASQMAVLDTSFGSEARILVSPQKEDVGTIDEGVFGDVLLADIFYFPSSVNRGVHIVPFAWN